MFKITPLPQPLKLSDFRTLIATGLGSGLIKPAPGTWGTLAFLPLMLPILFISWPLKITFLIVLFALAYWSTAFISKQTNEHDQGFIVIDEACGLAVAFLFISFSWIGVFLAFALFRLFDILKPWPIYMIDRKLNNSCGVILDDVLAGLAAGVCVYVLGDVYAF